MISPEREAGRPSASSQGTHFKMFERLTRRQILSASGALLGSTLLAGCGFRLRGHFDAPFETLYLQMTENTRFSGLLKRMIESGSSIRCVSSPREADAILELLSMTRSRDILTINDAGRAASMNSRSRSNSAAPRPKATNTSIRRASLRTATSRTPKANSFRAKGRGSALHRHGERPHQPDRAPP